MSVSIKQKCRELIEARKKSDNSTNADVKPYSDWEYFALAAKNAAAIAQAYLELEDSFEASRYRYAQIEPAVSQMGGWANFRYWIVRHAVEYFETCVNLEAENTKLQSDLELSRMQSNARGQASLESMKHLEILETENAELKASLKRIQGSAFEPEYVKYECRETLAKYNGGEKNERLY